MLVSTPGSLFVSLPPSADSLFSMRRTNLIWALYTSTGAFTPGRQGSHLPSYIEELPELQNKGVHKVAIIAFNDSWVIAAWGKANGGKGDHMVCSIVLGNIRA